YTDLRQGVLGSIIIILVIAVLAAILHFSRITSHNEKDVSTVLDGTKSLDAPINDQNPYQNKSDFTDAKLTSDKKEILTADVLQKGFKTEFYDEILFCKVKFTNLSDKNITRVRGTLHLYDQSNNVIHSFGVYLDSKYDGSMKAKKSVIKQIGGIGFDDHYNQFNEKDRLFVHTDLSRMRIVWEPEQIVFSGGTAIAYKKTKMQTPSIKPISKLFLQKILAWKQTVNQLDYFGSYFLFLLLH
ncbi:MAG: hypothetical protein M3342_20765, partial [Bacteroidota bacterium]|nr:hypothetical protein [Bacteroidota bacterium]